MDMLYHFNLSNKCLTVRLGAVRAVVTSIVATSVVATSVAAALARHWLGIGSASVAVAVAASVMVASARPCLHPRRRQPPPQVAPARKTDDARNQSSVIAAFIHRACAAPGRHCAIDTPFMPGRSPRASPCRSSALDIVTTHGARERAPHPALQVSAGFPLAAHTYTSAAALLCA
ncbi:hypothetical protein [Burkholderia sp. MSMB617WGS]|uniref:hypothetical protein n=1 Tax=Burkholderia sp. MSMB617WGS TaxID=1637831 RepID=UPI001645D0CF|nr:hypothetical protein [Burkholderia sp. MSMB617WGS]